MLDKFGSALARELPNFPPTFLGHLVHRLLGAIAALCITERVIVELPVVCIFEVSAMCPVRDGSPHLPQGPGRARRGELSVRPEQAMPP